jgi:hypothetical protein
MLVMTMFAEAAHCDRFNDYRLIHDNVEGGALMDMSKYFGSMTAERLEEPPHGTSEWVEDFYYNLDSLYKDGKPFIYALDSMDSINSRQDSELFQLQKTARLKDQDAKGGFHLAKPKINSEGLRKAMSELPVTGSMLFIISQTRAKIGGGFGDDESQSGGRALKHYTRLQLWTVPGRALKKTVNGVPHQIGSLCKVQVRKNHVVGNKRTITFPILNEIGIDDVTSCIDWLINVGQWKQIKQSVVAEELRFKGLKSKLISMIENEGRQKELRVVVASTWRKIEEQCKSGRPGRYK